MKKIIVLALIIISVFAVYGVAKCSKKETTEPKTDVATYQPVEEETIAETTAEGTTADSKKMVEKDTQYNLEDLSFIIPAKWEYSESDTISEQYVHIISANGAIISVSKVNGDIEKAKEKETEEINNLKETGANTVNYVFLKESINGYNIESGTAIVHSDPLLLIYYTYLFPYNDNTTYVIKFGETNISNGAKEDIELYKNYYLNKVTLK